MTDSTRSPSGVIAWFTRNPVAANLMMGIIIATGLMAAMTIKKEIQPVIELSTINIQVPYLGASPEEIEQGVLLKVEQALSGLEGIDEITATASEGMGTISVDVTSGADIGAVLDEVKLRVDAIDTFPAETEQPIISRPTFRQTVIWLSIAGDVDERTLKRYAQTISDEIVALPEVSAAEIAGERDYEIAIEVSEGTLRKYGLTFDEVVRAVQASSLDLPGGSIRSSGGDILLRTQGQAYTGDEFARLPLRSLPDGRQLLLGDIATIIDGFVETNALARFDGKPALSIQALSFGDESELEIAQAVKDYVAERQQTLPPELTLAAWADVSYYLKGRLELMNTNLAFGAVLVFLVLTLFLRLKLAFWVIVGIPVCFLGALFLMSHTGISINMLSLFGFILVLGIVVDDAIIIGESIFSYVREHGHSVDNVIRGAQEVAMPATFGVLTTMVAFLPLVLVGGTSGPFWMAIGGVVVFCLIFSLVESKLILPAHLAQSKWRPVPVAQRNAAQRFQRFFADGLDWVVEHLYRPALDKALANRYVTIASFCTVLVLSVALLISGTVRFVFFPNLSGDFVQAAVSMNEGSSPAAVVDAINRMETELMALDQQISAENGLASGAAVQHVVSWVENDLNGQLVVELTKNESSVIDAEALLQRWRVQVGDIPGARELSFSGATNTGGGPPISFRLIGRDYAQLEAAAAELEAAIRGFDGVYDIRNSFNAGVPEIKLSLKPQAEALGLNLEDLARQVRQGFYGAEAQRIQRDQDDVRVMVRYPRSERASISDLEQMRIRTADGSEVPFATVAEASFGSGFATIRRVDRQRAVTVTAEADLARVQPSDVVSQIGDDIMPDILARYPGVESRLSGGALEQQEQIAALGQGALLALFAIFALMAIPLKSYVQPFIVMAVIPFGIIGAIFGHLLFDQPVSLLSMFGLIALAGVVVNDSLIMVDFVNREVAKGRAVIEAARQAGGRRFRAILLTSLTTFFGLLPIVTETSLQAQIVVPMALSLAFGILFATVITLFLVPCLYLMLDDIKRFYAGHSWRDQFQFEAAAHRQPDA